MVALTTDVEALSKVCLLSYYRYSCYHFTEVKVLLLLLLLIAMLHLMKASVLV